MKRKRRALGRKNKRMGMLLCVPAMVIVAFALYTLLYALVMSFNTNMGVVQGHFEFAGFDNYIETLKSKEMRSVIGNTLLYAAATILVELGIGLLVSAALRKNVKGSGIAKVCIILPMMMASIASGTIWRWMFTDRYGVINYFLNFLHIDGPMWLSEKMAAKFAVLTVSVWTAAPFVILVLLASISSVSDDIIEAAKIDGANQFQAYWYIIFPHLRSAIAVILLIRIPDALKMYDIVYILTGGGPSNSTQVISYYVVPCNRGVYDLVKSDYQTEKRRCVRMGKKKWISNLYTYCVLVIASVFMVFPFLWLVLSSLKTEVQLFEVPIHILPDPSTLQNYRDVIADGSMFMYMKNSLIIALITTAITLVISIPAAYALAKIRFRAGTVFFMVILVIRMVPAVTQLLPLFQILSKFHLINTRTGLIISYLPGSVIFAVMLMRTFFMEFPQELEDAGKIDGLGLLGVIRRLVIPISLPGICSATLMSFLSTWNEFMYASVIIRSPELKTMPLGIQSYVSTFQIYWGKLTANAVIYVLPVIIFTMFASKGLIKGMTAGAVKE